MNDKEKKFKSLAENRTRKALKMIKLVGNLANRSHYDFQKSEADKIIKALRNEISAVEAGFKSKKSREDIDFSL